MDTVLAALASFLSHAGHTTTRLRHGRLHDGLPTLGGAAPSFLQKAHRPEVAGRQDAPPKAQKRRSHRPLWLGIRADGSRTPLAWRASVDSALHRLSGAVPDPVRDCGRAEADVLESGGRVNRYAGDH